MAQASAGGQRRRLFVLAHSLHVEDGGMETVHVRLMAELADRFEIHAISRRLDPSLEGRVRLHRVPVPARPVALCFALYWLVASAMLARLRREGDLVHSCGAIVAGRVDVASVHTLSAAVVAARGGRLTPSGLSFARRLNSGLLRWQALRAERRCYRPARTAVAAAVSAQTASEVEAFYPGLAVAVVPNGVDLQRYRPDAAARGQLRAELGIPAEAFTVAFVGGDFERKGLGLAIEAVAAVSGAQLLVAGAGDLDRARLLAERLGAGQRVHLLGPRRDVERVLAAADAYVSASDYEADSLALLEAAASALPLVATRVGSAEALVGEGASACGILVERDAPAIARALEQLAAAPELRAQLGARAAEAASARSWAASARQLATLLGGA